MTGSRKLIIAIVSTIGLAGLTLAGLIALRLFFFNFVRVPQDGMYPTISAGNYALTQRRPYREVGEVKRGDIVVFMKTEQGNDYKYIWRVVGLPGDMVEVSGESVKINGRQLPRELVRKDQSFSIYREQNGEASYEVAYDSGADPSQQPEVSLTVPPDQIFVLGDNRYYALDSTHVGPIAFASIIEKKIF